MSRVQFTSAKNDGEFFPSSKKGDLILGTSSDLQNIRFGAPGGSREPTMTIGESEIIIDRPLNMRKDVTASNIKAVTLEGEGQNIRNLDATNITSGVISADRGGTGKPNLTSNKVLIGGNPNGIESPDELHWDSNNFRLGINTSTPQKTLDINGSVRITENIEINSNLILIGGKYEGDGSGLCNLNASELTQGVINVSQGGTGLTELPRYRILVGDGSNGLMDQDVLTYDTSNVEIQAPIDFSSNAYFRESIFLQDLTEIRTRDDLSIQRVTLSNTDIQDFGFDFDGDRIIFSNTVYSDKDLQLAGEIIFSDGSRLTSADSLGYNGLYEVNGDVGIGIQFPGRKLDVDGIVRAQSFEGDGSALTNLDPANLKGIVDVAQGGTGKSSFGQNRLLVGNDANSINAYTGLEALGSELRAQVPTVFQQKATFQQALVLSDNTEVKSRADLKPAALYESNNNIGIDVQQPSERLEVNGVVKASGFAGAASDLTDLNIDAVSGGILRPAYGGTGVSELPVYRVLLGAGLNGITTSCNLLFDGTKLEVKTDAEFDKTVRFADAIKLADGTLISSRDDLNVQRITLSNSNSDDFEFDFDGSRVVFAHTVGVDSNLEIQGQLVFSDGSTLNSADAIGFSEIAQRNSNIGIGNDSPAYKLDVNGTVNAAEFRGDAGRLTNIPTSNLVGTVPVSHGGLGVSSVIRNAFLMGDDQNPVKSYEGLQVGLENLIAKTPVRFDSNATFQKAIILSDGTTVESKSDLTPSEILQDANKNVGISQFNPTEKLDVNGRVRATAFLGDGAEITDLSACNITEGVLSVNYGGTGRNSLPIYRVLVGNETSGVLAYDNLTFDDSNLSVKTSSRFEGDVEIRADLFLSDGTRLSSRDDLSIQQVTLSNSNAEGFGFDFDGERVIFSNILRVEEELQAAKGVRFSDGSTLSSADAIGYTVITQRNSNIGINEELPSSQLHVKGTTKSTAFEGDGAKLTNLSASSLDGILSVPQGGSGRGDFTPNKLLMGNGTGALTSFDGLEKTSAGITVHDATTFDDSVTFSSNGFVFQDGTVVSSKADLKPSQLYEQNGNLGINVLQPSSALEVSGTVKATAFEGDGAALTNISVASLSGANGSSTLMASLGGTGRSELPTYRLLVGNADSVQVYDSLISDGQEFTLDQTAVFKQYVDFKDGLELSDGTVLRSRDDLSIQRITLSNSNTDGFGFDFDGEKIVMSNVLSLDSNLEVRGTIRFFDGSTLASASEIGFSEITQRDSNIGIGNAFPTAKLDVDGSVKATAFQGDGSGLTNISLSGLSTGEALDVRRGGTGASRFDTNRFLLGAGTNALESYEAMRVENNKLYFDTDLVCQSNVRFNQGFKLSDGTSIQAKSDLTPAEISRGANGEIGISQLAPSATLDVGGTAKAQAFSGDGASLTNLSADSISSGTLSVSHGGTGRGSLPIYRILVGNAENGIQTYDSFFSDGTETRLAQKAIFDCNVEFNSGLELSDGTILRTRDDLSIQRITLSNSNMSDFGFDYDGDRIIFSDTVFAECNLQVGGEIEFADGSKLASAGDLGYAEITERNANIGIGVEFPSEKLDVAGVVQAASFKGDGSQLTNIGLNSVSGVLGMSQGGLGVTSLPQNRLIIGNGTSSPTGYGGISLTNTEFQMNTNSVFNQTSTFNANIVLQDGTTLASAEDLKPSQLTQKNGNLGVGVSDPTTKLHVSGTVLANEFQGNGRNVSDIDMDNVSRGILDVQHGGTGRDALSRFCVMVGNGTDGVLTLNSFTSDGSNITIQQGSRFENVAKFTDALELSDGTVLRTRDDLSIQRITLSNSNADGFGFDFDGEKIVMSNVLSLDSNLELRGKIQFGDGSEMTSADDFGYTDLYSYESNIGIGEPFPSAKLEVNGKVKATSLEGDGSAIANIAISNIDGLIPLSKGGTGLNLVEQGRFLTGPTSGGAAALDVYNGMKFDSGELTISDAVVFDSNATVSGTLTLRDGTELRGEQDLLPGIFTLSNSMIGINLATGAVPSEQLEVDGAIKATSGFKGSGAEITALDMGNVSAGTLEVKYGGIGTDALTSGKLLVGNDQSALQAPNELTWDAATGDLGIQGSVSLTGVMSTDSNIVIGTQGRMGVGLGASETPVEKLHVNGNMLVTGESHLQNKVGINTTSPEHELDVNGSVKIRDEFFLLSDKRLKTNIRPLENALQKTEALQGVSFNRSDKVGGDEKPDKTYLGFIAQDVEKIIPEAINYNADIDEYSMNYIDLIAVTVESIKTLAAQNTALQQRVSALEKK